MTVKELRTILANLPDDCPVHIAYPANDYWRTTLAPEARNVERGNVRHSAYHDADVITEGDSEEAREVLVIS